MKQRGSVKRVRRGLRRCVACFLAVVGLWMASMTAGLTAPWSWLGNLGGLQPAMAAQPAAGDGPAVPLWQRLLLGESAMLAQWGAQTKGETLAQSTKPEETPPEEAEEEQNLGAVTPGNIQERTISGSGSGYVNDQGISLFNRTKKSVDLAAVAKGGTSLTFGPAQAGPQILIIHTHGTESFARDGTEPYTETGTAHTTDSSYNIIQVGDEIARIFTEMGLNVIHDTEFYDYPSYNGAYERSKAGAVAILKEHPTIQMVLDVHRDALVGTDGTIYKPVIQIDGKKTAQVMLLVGTDDAGANFPDWTEHLALAMDIQEQMNALWPGLARPITLRTASFNQQMTKGSLLVEVGSHGNSLEEALAGARLFARAAGQVLKSMETQG